MELPEDVSVCGALLLTVKWCWAYLPMMLFVDPALFDIVMAPDWMLLLSSCCT